MDYVKIKLLGDREPDTTGKLSMSHLQWESLIEQFNQSGFTINDFNIPFPDADYKKAVINPFTFFTIYYKNNPKHYFLLGAEDFYKQYQLIPFYFSPGKPPLKREITVATKLSLVFPHIQDWLIKLRNEVDAENRNKAKVGIQQPVDEVKFIAEKFNEYKSNFQKKSNEFKPGV